MFMSLKILTIISRAVFIILLDFGALPNSTENMIFQGTSGIKNWICLVGFNTITRFINVECCMMSNRRFEYVLNQSFAWVGGDSFLLKTSFKVQIWVWSIVQNLSLHIILPFVTWYFTKSFMHTACIWNFESDVLIVACVGLTMRETTC